jgi:hypothetical protein
MIMNIDKVCHGYWPVWANCYHTVEVKVRNIILYDISMGVLRKRIGRSEHIKLYYYTTTYMSRYKNFTLDLLSRKRRLINCEATCRPSSKWKVWKIMRLPLRSPVETVKCLENYQKADMQVSAR